MAARRKGALMYQPTHDREEGTVGRQGEGGRGRRARNTRATPVRHTPQRPLVQRATHHGAVGAGVAPGGGARGKALIAVGGRVVRVATRNVRRVHEREAHRGHVRALGVVDQRTQSCMSLPTRVSFGPHASALPWRAPQGDTPLPSPSPHILPNKIALLSTYRAHVPTRRAQSRGRCSAHVTRPGRAGTR